MTNTKPELPEPAKAEWAPDDVVQGDILTAYYTADQLRAYGDEREAYGRASAPAEVPEGIVLMNYIAHMKEIGGCEPPAWWAAAYQRGYDVHEAERNAAPAAREPSAQCNCGLGLR